MRDSLRVCLLALLGVGCSINTDLVLDSSIDAGGIDVVRSDTAGVDSVVMPDRCVRETCGSTDECWIRDDTCGGSLDCGRCPSDLGCDNDGSCVTCESVNEPNGWPDVALVAPSASIGMSQSFASTLHEHDDSDMVRVRVLGTPEAQLDVSATGFSPFSDYNLLVIPFCGSSPVRTPTCILGSEMVRNLRDVDYLGCGNAPGADRRVVAEVRCDSDVEASFIVHVRSSDSWDSCNYELEYSLNARVGTDP